MSEASFTSALESGRVLLLDGAMGTMLQAAGLPLGMAPELFCLERPDILLGIHESYIRAGADIVTSCTFGANPWKLPPGQDVAAINRRLAGIAREAASRAGRRVFVAGNVGPSGHFTKPLGDLEPADLVAGYARQIEGLVAGGADLIFVETQFDLAEARGAAMAARSVCDLALMVSMTFEDGLSLTGSTPEIFAESMQNLSVDALGANCSLGPAEMLPVVRELLASACCPVMAEPNAGLPILRGKETVFPLGPEPFAEKTMEFARMGARILGGCCGTSPAHIMALRRLLEVFSEPPKKAGGAGSAVCLSSRSRLVRLGGGYPFQIIGERINPTGKKALAGELQKGSFAEAVRLADAQLESGANVLDVNVGAPLVDERELLPALARTLVSRLDMPLSLDSSDAAAIEATLPYCPGSFLVNSLSGERDKMELLGPLCRDYGAPFILLPLRGPKLPESARERREILEMLLLRAEELRIPRRLVLVDVLAMSAAASPGSAGESLAMIRWCSANGLPTTCGLSNISFGLPARDLLNATFLSMCAGAGLSSCIANPSAPRLREAFDAMRLLQGHDSNAAGFIAGYGDWKPQTGIAAGSSLEAKKAGSVGEAVLSGDMEGIVPLVRGELDKGREAYAIVSEELIPAITEVGNRYERKEYFLPQLIRSAETMQKAIGYLEPELKKRPDAEKRPVIVLATVEGDIHDIGKNIVALLLENHGFDVIDAGKDVPAETIVGCAESHNASLIGLSALMTTTMVRMEDTVRLVRDRGLPIRILVGGAAVTPEFAARIGADAYCEDAVATVRVARGFCGDEGSCPN